MSHLGDLLAAHIDGELDGAERDKVSAHLARCEHCRAEAAELRELKRQIGALAAEVPGEADMTRRLLEQAVVRTGDLGRRPRVLLRPAKSLTGQRGRTGARAPAGLAGPSNPAGPAGPVVSRRPRRRARLTKRRRYLVLGTVSIVMGLGTAAFSVGGGDPAPGPRVVPQVGLYSEEHAITTGGVPFDGPGPAMGPVMSAVASASSPAARQP